MKKILLSLVALMSIALSANAQTEPTYVAKGTMGIVPEGWETYSSVIPDTVTDVDVEVYGNDSIIIRNYCGVENFDLVAVLNPEDTTVTSFHCWYYSDSQAQDVKYENIVSGMYSYVYTGLDNPYGMYLCTYTGYTDLVKDDETQSGSISCGYVTAYSDDGNGGYTSTLGGYYITWEAAPKAAAEPTYVAKGTVGVVPEGWESFPALVSGVTDIDVEVYGNDSIIFRNYCGVETFDLVAVLNPEDTTVTSFYCWYYSNSQAQKVKYEYGGNNWYYTYTGLDDPYGLNFYTASGYTDLVKDDEAQTGSLACAYVYAYGDTTSPMGGFYITWAPVATGISSVNATPARTSSAVYNLAGQRVSPNTKGLVIKDGKKMFIK